MSLWNDCPGDVNRAGKRSVGAPAPPWSRSLPPPDGSPAPSPLPSPAGDQGHPSHVALTCRELLPSLASAAALPPPGTGRRSLGGVVVMRLHGGPASLAVPA